MTTETSPRSAGILLHPTSLPGPYGIGDLGPSAYGWVDALARAGQRWWQVLPLGPTGFGDSPYACFSSFAANPLLISPDELADEGLVRTSDLENIRLPEDRVNYGKVIGFKNQLLTEAWANFKGGAAPALVPLFEEFCGRATPGMHDYSLFMAIKQRQGGVSWSDWPEELVLRRPEALDVARRELADVVRQFLFVQFLVLRQWDALRAYAREKGVRLIGDVPIFVAPDSADVWANPELFLLDERNRPRVVAGVPPDYFSATGQLWGNPHYNWDALKRTGYHWWLERIRALLRHVDMVRLDHFCGFERAWHIPAGSLTAEKGHYERGPGSDLFDTFQRELGGLPFIAEDLGVVTPEVEKLRDRYGLPGMLILQFAFGGATENRFLPHNFIRNGVVYTGTHDNDTTVGWYQSISEQERDLVRRYAGRDGSDVAWDLIRLAWMSVADMAITSLQDVLRLGHEGRMNLPGRPDGNWGWRFRWEMLTEAIVDRLGEFSKLYSR